jgi:hypothetical protein
VPVVVVRANVATRAGAALVGRPCCDAACMAPTWRRVQARRRPPRRGVRGGKAKASGRLASPISPSTLAQSLRHAYRCRQSAVPSLEPHHLEGAVIVASGAQPAPRMRPAYPQPTPYLPLARHPATPTRNARECPFRYAGASARSSPGCRPSDEATERRRRCALPTGDCRWRRRLLGRRSDRAATERTTLAQQPSSGAFPPAEWAPGEAGIGIFSPSCSLPCLPTAA